MSETPSEQDVFYEFVEKYISRDSFNLLWEGFGTYEDRYKRDILFNVCRTIEISNRIGFEDDLLDRLQLVQVTSIIELLTKRQDHIRFDKWYYQNAEKYKNKKCVNAWHDYNQNHGTTKNFRTFFSGLEKNEKFELLCTIKKNSKLSMECIICVIKEKNAITLDPFASITHSKDIVRLLMMREY